MTSLCVLLEKGSSVSKIRYLSVSAFKKLFKNHLKNTFPTFSSFSRVTSTFSDLTYGVL